MPNARSLARIALASAVGLALLGHSARAEDIDIYSLPATDGLRPNVLFLLDNTANWSSTIRMPVCDAPGANVDPAREHGTKMGAEKCAMYKVIESMSVPDLSQYNIAFMLFNESPDSSAYPRQAFINVQTAADKTRLLQFIANLHINGDKGNNAATAEAFYEAWLYFASNTVRLGNRTPSKHDVAAFTDGSKTRYAGPSIGCTKNHIIYLANGAPGDNNNLALSLLQRLNPGATRTRIPVSEGVGNRTPGKHDVSAFTDGSKTRYAGPSIGCTKNHIIYLANGAPGDNNNLALSLLQRLNPGATRTRIPVSEGVGNNDEANWADEFAAFFNRGADLDTTSEGAQNISVHTIAVTGASSDGNFPNYIRWIATEGGGLYQEARDSESIIVGLTNVLNQIRSANSVFSSASLPVSANTQGTYLNQVFIGMFRPDGNALQRWVGNLKQYQFLYDAQRDQLQLADVNQQPAVSATSGFIVSTATSFWTQPSSFWINAEASSSGRYSRSDAPDGELVEKGGVAQWLRTNYATSASRTSRPVYTCVWSDCNSGTVDLAAAGSDYRFSTSNSRLDADMFRWDFTDSERDRLINWVRGEENVLATNVFNYSVAKDQLTSPPTGVNVRPSIHGDVLHSRPVAINYGGTRGVVVYYGSNDGIFRAVNGNQTGVGAGSEMWGFVAPEHYRRLNRLRENSPEVRYPSTPLANMFARSRDYFFDGPIGAYQNTITNEVMIFPAMRRGGRSVYAFNVTNPDQPRLMWRLHDGRTDYENLGQTWSMPRVAMIKDRADPVLIMGGGYDPAAEDVVPGAATTMGRGVYVINMRTGDRLARLPTDFSVPADVSIVDTDGDGYVDRAYVVDVRAQVYRIDIENADGTAKGVSNWVITKIAALNDGTGGLDGTRKVFFAPDVVLSRNYTSLLLGTGDREKPLSTTSNDRFYVIKDAKITKGEPTTVTLITDASLAALGTDGAGADTEGCAYSFATNGERVINQPITFGGITYFSTNRPLPPAAGRCSRAQNRSYQVPLVCRPPTYRDLVGDGLPPSPVVGYVDVGGGKLVPFVIGGPNDKNSAIEVNRAVIPIPAKRKRSYWFMDNRDR